MGECWQGFSCGSSPGVCGQSQPQRVFRRCMCGSVHSQKWQPGVCVWCWRTAARSLSGLSVVRLGEGLRRFQSLMCLPVWWLVWWRWSTREQCPCRWRLWRSRKPSAGSCSTQMACLSWSKISEGQFGLQAWRWMEPWTGLCRETAEFLWHSLERGSLGFQRTFPGQGARH